MKKISLLSAMLFSFAFCTAQVVSDSGNHGLMLLATKDSQKMNKIMGSPYLEEGFKQGIILIQGKEPLDAFVRSNVHQDQIEVKLAPQDDKIYLLPKNSNTEYKIGEEKIIFESLTVEGETISGYFIEHYNGGKFRLLEKPMAIVTEAIEAKTGYDRDKPARIKIEEEYFVIGGGKIENVPLKHRNVKKIFNSKDSKEYLSDNKVRSEEDLVSFITWLDNRE